MPSLPRIFLYTYEDDPRNNLINQFSRFVEDLHPKTVMFENIPGLADDNRLQNFCDMLKHNGYYYTKDILDVSNMVSQKEKSLILLSSRLHQINFVEPDIPKVTVRDTMEKLPKSGTSVYKLHDTRIKFTPKVQEIIKIIPKYSGSRRNLF